MFFENRDAISRAGNYGGSRKGQSFDLSVLATKERLKVIFALPWHRRVQMVIMTARMLGCEFPTEGTYKLLTSLVMLGEDLLIPAKINKNAHHVNRG